MANNSLSQIFENPSLENLFQALTPLGFAAALIFVGFVIALLLAFLLWYRRLVRLTSARHSERASKKEIERLEFQNRSLQAKLEARVEELKTANKPVESKNYANVGSHSDALGEYPEKSEASPPLSLFTVPDIHDTGTSLSALEAVDAETVAELERIGIRHIEQLEALSPEDREVLDAKLAFEGQKFDWSCLPNSRSLAGLDLPSVSGPEVDWMDGVSPELAAELQAMGIKSPEQLEALDAEQRAKLDARLAEKGLEWDWGWIANWKTGLAGAAVAGAAWLGMRNSSEDDGSSATSPSHTASNTTDASLGFDLPDASGPEVNWGDMDGVSPELASELQAMGIKSPEQLEALDADQRAKLDARLADKGLEWDWGWIANWKTGLAGAAAAGAAWLGMRNSSEDDSSNESASHTANSTSDASLGFELPDVSGSEVNWNEMDGVSPELASELQAMDIKSPEQLEALDAEQRAKLDARFADKGLEWDWGWIANWKTGLAGAAAAGAAWLGMRNSIEDDSSNESASHTANSTSDASLGFELPDVSGSEVNWNEMDGVSPELASELQALGIKSPDQLEALDAEQRAKLDARLADKGLEWDWGWIANWKTGLAGAAAAGAAWLGMRNSSEDESSTESPSHTASSTTAAAIGFDSPEVSGPEVNWSEMDGVSPELAAELQAMGIKSPEQLEALDAEQRAKLDARLADKGLKWDWGWIANWKTGLAGAAAAGAAWLGMRNSSEDGFSNESASHTANSTSSLGFDLPDVSGSEVNWGEMDGVSPELAAQLQAMGIKSPEQLEALDAEQRAKLDARLADRGLKWDWGWIANWKTGLAGATTASLVAAQGANSRYSAFGSYVKPQATANPPSSNHAPVLIAHKVGFKDDLTLLDGIDGPQAAELRKMGICNFEQLHNLSLQDRERLQNWFRKRGWRLDMEQWRIASEGNTLHPSMDDIRQKAYEIYEARSAIGHEGGERTDWEQAEWELRGNPIFNYGVPHHVDDFAVNVTGVSPEAREELYRMGLYNKWQIDQLDKDTRRMLTRWFAGPRFSVDLTQAFGWLGCLDSVPSGLNFGEVHSVRPDRVDDLSLIHGLSDHQEHELNRLGIYQFSQIANWTQQQREAVSQVLDLGNRISERNWVQQAKVLQESV